MFEIKKLNPASVISSKSIKIFLWILLFSTLLLFILISVLDIPLKTATAPGGIVSFELAGNFLHSQKILESWNHKARLNAIQSLVADYLFLISYSFLFAFTIFIITKFYEKVKNNLFVKVGIFLGWLQFVAAIFDSFENYFLLRIIFGSQNPAYPEYAFYFASLKFLIILLGLGYIVLGLVARFKTYK